MISHTSKGKSKRHYLGITVFDAALQRLMGLMGEGHRIVVSFSGGKDSAIVLELTILAAEATGNLPVDVVMRDEEIAFPGTYEFCERTAARPEVRFHWLVANQPIVNIFSRRDPYFWVFDPELPEEEWVRRPPADHTRIDDINIVNMITRGRFPVGTDRWLLSAIGLRIQESGRRALGLASMQNYYTKERGQHRVRNLWPIYDWKIGDVWHCFNTLGWDYNTAYNTLTHMGVRASDQRIGPPTMTPHSIKQLQIAARAWPLWFDAVCRRLPGVRSAGHFGMKAIMPTRQLGESWQECFRRVCLEDAPAWISERAEYVSWRLTKTHERHSTAPFPDIKPCFHCTGGSTIACWKKLTIALYGGDPFGLKTDGILKVGKNVPPLHRKYIDPEYFRPGSGTFAGRPSF